MSRGNAPNMGAFQSPLRDYSFIADGHRGALIGPRGDIAWMCFPGWADPAIFAGLLGSGGLFRLAPASDYVTGGYYEQGSLIWHSRWVTHQGIFESRDALAYPSSASRCVILRRVYAVEGECEMVVEFAPAADYGRAMLSGWHRRNGALTVREGPLYVRLLPPAEAEFVPRGLRGGARLHFRVEPGRHYDFLAEFVSGSPPGAGPLDPDECWRATESRWSSMVPECPELIASSDARLSLAVLRGMTAPGGATVAAATTSLPEREDSDRNYDYRFCWVRDTCFVGHAGASVPGGEPILDGAVSWVGERLLERRERTVPAYLVNGDPISPPSRLEVPGYPGGTDIVGNRVAEQFQLDMFGESLLLFAHAARLGRLEGRGWEAARVALEAIEKRWDEPEAGIWEIEPRRWTQSRLACVAGLKAISAADPPGNGFQEADPLADRLLKDTAGTSVHETGRWQRASDDDRVDASLLLGEIRGALPPSDSRSELTRRAVATDLAREHFLYRYRSRGQELGKDEGAFLICNFWMALAAKGAGRDLEATRWFERGRSAMSTAGLFSEEFDTYEHQLRGNLPQAFVHAMFVESAVTLSPC